MLESVQIRGFRAFGRLRIEDLGRVNLFVGRNNSGKTTILEAVEILVSGDKLAAVVGCAMRRGEVLVQKEPEKREREEIDISHVFHGHSLEAGSNFEISGEKSGVILGATCEIRPSEESRHIEKELFTTSYDLRPVLAVLIRDIQQEEPLVVPLSVSGGIPRETLRRQTFRPSGESNPVTCIRTEALDGLQMYELWDSIALREEESNVIETLRILEPRIDRIAFLSQRLYRYYASAGGIYVKLNGFEDRIPLGSLGDGIRHLLAISLGLSRSKHGFVIIDEIDTGLHYSVMDDMWRALIKTAKRLNVQVFATTHSQDCVRSLAWVHRTDPDLCNELRLHRVDAQRESTVAYTPEEISVAAEQRVELRG